MIRVLEMGSKLNVVDDQNNFVGFDLYDDCCSRGGYFISHDIFEENFVEAKGVEDREFPGFVFDMEFFKEGSSGEENVVIFKFVSPDEPGALYLHLFNVHNGYYAKGFVCTFGGKQSGSI